MQNLKLTDDFHRQSVDNDNPGLGELQVQVSLMIQNSMI